MSTQSITELEQKAIQAAKAQDWDTAISANADILAEAPENVPAMVRLGVAKVQIGNNSEAKKLFEAALDLDKSNALIKKHLQKLKNKQPIQLSKLANTEEFIEEPGKTKIAELHRLASKDQLVKATVGSLCDLKSKSRFMSVELGGKYLGSLPEDLSARLSRLISSGNTYACYVQSVSPTTCMVFLKELERSKQNQYVTSFPVNKAQTGPMSEYMTDDAMPIALEDIAFEVVATDEDDDHKAPDTFPLEEGDERDRERERGSNDDNDE